MTQQVDKQAELENAVIVLKARVFDLSESNQALQQNLSTLQSYLSQVVELLEVPVNEGTVNIEDILESIRSIKANVVAQLPEECLTLEDVADEPKQ